MNTSNVTISSSAMLVEMVTLFVFIVFLQKLDGLKFMMLFVKTPPPRIHRQETR